MLTVKAVRGLTLTLTLTGVNFVSLRGRVPNFRAKCRRIFPGPSDLSPFDWLDAN